jgi:hypothetical protein
MVSEQNFAVPTRSVVERYTCLYRLILTLPPVDLIFNIQLRKDLNYRNTG